MAFAAKTTPALRLAPLQEVMLRDTLEAPNAGRHVEQVEIVFSRNQDKLVESAWAATVAETAVLGMAFSLGNFSWMKAVEPNLLDDSQDPLVLISGAAPWKATYFPNERRFMWTFHHALLDGRSIVRVVRSFLNRLSGLPAEPLSLATWHAPTPAAVAEGAEIFERDFAELEPSSFSFPEEFPKCGQAIETLGSQIAKHLELIAGRLDVSAPAILTWAWGQALATAAGADAVMVEQVRSCFLPEGTAGFTMNTLPVIINLADSRDTVKSIQDFRRHLISLRSIERVSNFDFPPGQYPNTNAPGTSVVMVERGTLRHMVGKFDVEKLLLHERAGDGLTASAHLLPDLRLEVDGPARSFLLKHWIAQLEQLTSRF